MTVYHQRLWKVHKSDDLLFKVHKNVKVKIRTDQMHIILHMYSGHAVIFMVRNLDEACTAYEYHLKNK